MQEKTYKAICIDTSSYENHKFELSGPTFSSFRQFQNSTVSLLVPDIIKKEVISHMARNISESSSDASKALKKLQQLGVIDGDVVEKIKENIASENESYRLAEEKFNGFEELSGAKLITTKDYIDLDELFDLYFQGESPFKGLGKKKCEFPDACALLSLKKWSEMNNTNIVVVSSDDDWSDFAKNISTIKAFKNVNDALQFFQPTNELEKIFAFIKNDVSFEEKNLLENIEESVEEKVGVALEKVDFVFGVDVPVNWYSEWEHVTFESFRFITDKNGKIDFKVLSIEANKVQMSAPIVIKLNTDAEFSLYVRDTIDHEDVPMGSINVDRNIDIQAELFMSLDIHVSDALRQLNDISLTGVEIIENRIEIDFGYFDLFDPQYDEDYGEWQEGAENSDLISFEVIKEYESFMK